MGRLAGVSRMNSQLGNLLLFLFCRLHRDMQRSVTARQFSVRRQRDSCDRPMYWSLWDVAVGIQETTFMLSSTMSIIAAASPLRSYLSPGSASAQLPVAL